MMVCIQEQFISCAELVKHRHYLNGEMQGGKNEERNNVPCRVQTLTILHMSNPYHWTIPNLQNFSESWNAVLTYCIRFFLSFIFFLGLALSITCSRVSVFIHWRTQLEKSIHLLQ